MTPQPYREIRLPFPPHRAHLRYWGQTPNNQWWGYIAWEIHATYRDHHTLIEGTAWINSTHIEPAPGQHQNDHQQLPRFELLPNPETWPAPIPILRRQPTHYMGVLNGQPLPNPAGYTLLDGNDKRTL